MKRLLLKTTLAFGIFLAAAIPLGAQQWVFQGGKQTNNGSVTVRSVDGSTSQAATQNPTGAAAKVNQTAVTQPPVMVMQATARLPVVVEGAVCNVATDQVAVTSANKILSCQGGTWKGNSAGLGEGQTWQNVTGSRSNGSWHKNTAGRAISVHATTPDTNSAPQILFYVAPEVCSPTCTIGPALLIANDYKHAPVARWWQTTVYGIVPANYYYMVSSNVGIESWHELR